MNLKTVFTFCLTLLIICTLSSFMPIHNEDDIYESVIRLHIIANSNSDYDQSLKLKVRDEILASHLLEGVADIIDAERLIETSASSLLECAEKATEKYGNSERVTLEWGYERYPTRYYSDTVYPAGRYRSLRIIIGDGEGENWWCVMFPPLCTESGVAKIPLGEEAKKTFTLGGDKKYTIRLKILEWFSFYD